MERATIATGPLPAPLWLDLADYITGTDGDGIADILVDFAVRPVAPNGDWSLVMVQLSVLVEKLADHLTSERRLLDGNIEDLKAGAPAALRTDARDLHRVASLLARTTDVIDRLAREVIPTRPEAGGKAAP